jgi:uncharacterized protein YndB with AHSA1/START domain
VSEIRFETIYPSPVAAVWQALTDPAELGIWLMESDFEPALGHAFTFRTEPRPGFDGVVHCRVLEIEPERRLSYSWAGGGIDTVVTWTLRPHGEGTAVELVHSGFAGIKGMLIQKILGSGWKSKILKALGERSATIHARPRRR